jgi:hypothetical protein
MGMQSLVDHLGPTSSWCALKVDMANAFNTVDRTAMLKATLHYTPALYNFLRFAYGLPAPLHINDEVSLLSRTGTHQGCPLGPVGFALAIHPTVERLQKVGGLVWNSWYLDDGLLVGTAEAVRTAFSMLSADLQSIGLRVNASKCEVWGPEAHLLAHACPEVTMLPWTPETGITVLGIPVDFPGSHA